MTKKQKENNNEIQKQNFNKLRDLEQMYCTGEVNNMLEKIEEQKKDLVGKMIEYSEKHNEPCKWDKEGNPLDYEVKLNPLVINNYFFKPIIPISSQEPKYNAEKLGMVYDYYCDLISEVNDKIGAYPSSLSSFCKFAGITTNTLRNYKNSNDYSLRVIANKIYDQVGDENMTLGQLGKTKERMTIFKMKAQNEMVEKPRTNINVNVDVKPDYDSIEEKLNNYKDFIDNKR